MREWRSVAALAAASCGLAGLLPMGAGAELGAAPDAGTWVADGPVYSIARSGDRTFIGGDFSRVGPRTGSGVPLAPLGTPESGNPMPGLGSFPEVAGGRVLDAVADDEGNWYIGGSFTHVGGQPRSGLARLTPDGPGRLTTDPDWDPRPAGVVRSVALGEAEGKDTDTLYVGGRFDSLGGDIGVRNFGAVDRNTGLPVGQWPTPDDTVSALDVLKVTLQEGTPPATSDASVVFIGGAFLNVTGAASRSNITALWGLGAGKDAAGKDRSGSLTNFALDSTRPGVKSLLVGPPADDAAGNRTGAPVYLSSDAGLTTYKFDVVVKPEGGVVGTVNGNETMNGGPSISAGSLSCSEPACSPTIDVLETSASGSALYLGGLFMGVGEGQNLVAVSGVTTVYEPGPGLVPRGWDPAPDGRVRALARSAPSASLGALYVGGDFGTVAAGARAGVAAVAPSASDSETTNDAVLQPWAPDVSGGLAGTGGGVVTALAATPTTVYAGGSFTSVGARPRENVAAFGPGGELVDEWRASANAPVRALATNGDKLYLGGSFNEVNDVPRTRLAAVTAAEGDLVPGFAPAAEPACEGAGCAAVLALGLNDGALYVGGSFARLADEDRRNAGAVDPEDGGVLGWAPNPNGTVHALLPTCDTVYAGGSFTSAGGHERRRIAAFDPRTGAATSWDPSASATVYALARDAEIVYAGGSFARIGGLERARLAGLDARTGAATAWNPATTGEQVRALAVPPGSSVVYAGGSFVAAGRADRSNLVAVNRTSGSATSWNPGADGTVRALTADGESLLVGGDFRRLGTLMQQGLGSFGIATGGPVESSSCAAPVTESPPVPEEVPQEEPPVVPPPPPAVEPPSEPLPDTLAPDLNGIGVTNKRFRTARRIGRIRAAARRAPVGTAFKYTLSEAGVVRFTFERRQHVRCRPKDKAPCYRFRAAGSLAHLSHAGALKLRFNGRVGKRWLRAGRYRVQTQAVDGAGNASIVKSFAFTVVKR